MNILLAADGSLFTTKAADFVVTHLDWLKSTPKIHILHVKQALPSGLATSRARALLGEDAVNNYYKEEATVALAVAEQPFLLKDIPFLSAYKVGDVVSEIAQYVEKNAIDVIVMGSHGHGALAGVILGSVSSKVLATTTVPVLIVR